MTEKTLKPVNPNNRYIQDYVEAVEKGMKSAHVIPLSSGRWVVKTLSSSKPLKTFADKTNAINFASALAQKSTSGVFLHTKAGEIIRQF